MYISLEFSFCREMLKTKKSILRRLLKSSGSLLRKRMKASVSDLLIFILSIPERLDLPCRNSLDCNNLHGIIESDTGWLSIARKHKVSPSYFDTEVDE